MDRTKVVIYQSCDLCGSEEEAKGRCNICDRYLCSEHYNPYPWADQLYAFCPEHYKIVYDKIKATRIPIGFVVDKLKGLPLSEYNQRIWDERGYEPLWRKEEKK